MGFSVLEEAKYVIVITNKNKTSAPAQEEEIGIEMTEGERKKCGKNG
jgi:hypothetical protein